MMMCDIAYCVTLYNTYVFVATGIMYLRAKKILHNNSYSRAGRVSSFGAITP